MIVVVLVVLAAVGVWMAFRPTSSSAEARQITYTVASGSVQQTVSASGTLTAAKKADLDFAVSGTVTGIYAEVGDHVKKGQVLARIDARTLKANRDAAEAALSAANSAYAADVDAGAGSAQLASDAAQVASAKATLSQARADLSDATLRSTISGVVASRDLKVGDTVSGGSAASSGSSGSSANSPGGPSPGSSSASSASDSSAGSAFVVMQPGRFEVVADVSADDISSVKKGMQVQLTTNSSSSSSSSAGAAGFGGFGGFGLRSRASGSTGTGSAGSGTGSRQASDSASKIFGTVASVSMIADSSSSGTGFPVTVQVTGVHKKLYAGTSVSVSIITKQLDDVLTVPATALSGSDGKTYVHKIVGDKIVRTQVTVGQTFGARTQITEGLSPGDKIQLGTGFARPTGSRQGEGGSGGGFPGGGFPGGGFPGGGFPGGGGLPNFGGGR